MRPAPDQAPGSPPGRIVRLSISRGGVPKLPVERALVGPLGLAGDGHRYRLHGGPERAVCIYSVELLAKLEAEGHPVFPGALGENVTTVGLDLASLAPGDRLRLGEGVILEITKRVTPCKTIAGCFAGGDFQRVSPVTRPADARLYARVLEGGEVATGDPVLRLGPGGQRAQKPGAPSDR